MNRSPVPEEEPASRQGLIVREEDPLNLEMPFSMLDGFITPNESFYVRCHFPIPEITVKDWSLSAEGAVKNPIQLNYDELLRMDSRTITATLECAGNNRLFLEPKVNGVQWALGAVGNAVWKGVPLSALLDRARLNPEAMEVILEGADGGSVQKGPSPAGKIHFARSVPLKKAMDDVLLAYEMNAEPLTASHGFPLRAIVPGWYAMASIKWIRRIIVTEEPFNGYYQTVDYGYWKRRGELSSLVPITRMQVKAEIAWPTVNEIVPGNSIVRVHGAAWSSAATITEVQISVDSGANWQQARLLDQAMQKNAWQLWEYDWHTPDVPGRQTLIARAIDALGRTQPEARDPDRGTYMISHLLPIQVEVR